MINRTNNILRVRKLNMQDIDFITHSYFSLIKKVYRDIAFIASINAINISNGNNMFHSNIFRVNFYKKVFG